MKWPWNNRRKQQREEQLKEELRQRAQQISEDRGEPEIEVPLAPSTTHQTAEPVAASTDPVTESKARAVAKPVQAKELSAEDGLPGTKLTRYVGKRARRAIVLESKLKPVRRARSQRGEHHYGRDLTLHINRRGKRRSLLNLVGKRSLNPILLVFWEFIKWLFYVKPRILIIERYIWAECFGYFLLGSFGFTIFMIITSIFSLGEKIFTKNIPPYTITKVLLISAPAFLVLALPVAVVFSSLMAMGRMNRDNEVVAFQTNGVSLYRIFVPFISIGIVAGISTWLIYEHVVPPNNREYKEVLKVFWTAQVVDFIKPQTIIKAPEYKYFYVEEINKTEGIMYNLRLYDYFRGEDQPMRRYPRIFVAEEARVIDQYLVLDGVRLYNLDQEKGDSIVCATMPQIKIDIGTKVVPYDIKPHPTELAALELRTRIVRLRDRINSSAYPNAEDKQTYLRDWTEYYFKYSIPVVCLAFVLVAVPVSLRGPRDERNLGLIQTFVVVMSFYILFFSARTLGSRGLVLTEDFAVGGQVLLGAGTNMFPPYLAGWFAQIVFFTGAVILIWRARK